MLAHFLPKQPPLKRLPLKRCLDVFMTWRLLAMLFSFATNADFCQAAIRLENDGPAKRITLHGSGWAIAYVRGLHRLNPFPSFCPLGCSRLIADSRLPLSRMAVRPTVPLLSPLTQKLGMISGSLVRSLAWPRKGYSGVSLTFYVGTGFSIYAQHSEERGRFLVTVGS